MHLTKTSITLPDDLLKEAKSLSKNFSGLVADALREYIRQRKIQKALESFGSWQEREASSVDMVNEMRKDEGRDYAGRAH
jgi:metal-responsive CopG/Arc/MetJ family transcriptional regulator